MKSGNIVIVIVVLTENIVVVIVVLTEKYRWASTQVYYYSLFTNPFRWQQIIVMGQNTNSESGKVRQTFLFFLLFPHKLFPYQAHSYKKARPLSISLA